MSDETQIPSTQTPPPRKGRGCFFYGCLTCLVLFLVACLSVFLVIQFVKSKINAFTDTAPMKLPKVEMTDAEYQGLDERVRAFSDAMQQGKPTPPLTLGERELNALILKSPNAKELADKVYVSLNGDQVKGQVSVPLDKFGWFGRGRYLNGEATFKVSLENGVLIVTPSEILVKSKPLPESIMKDLREKNLAQEAYKDPKNAQAISKFQSIQIKDSRVTIQARTNSAPAP